MTCLRKKISIVLLAIFTFSALLIPSKEIVQASTISLKDYSSSDYFVDDYFKMHINDNRTISVYGKSAIPKQDFCLSISNANVTKDMWGDINPDGTFSGISDMSTLADGEYKVTMYLGGWSTASGIPIVIEGGIANFTTSDTNTVNKNAMVTLSGLQPSLFLNTSYINATESQLTVIKTKALDITKNASSDYEKVRLIHDWVASNIYYNFDGLYSGNYGDNSPYTVFTSKIGVCQGYAELSEAMLRSIGIPTAIVTGRSINSSESWSTIADKDISDHAWNAAYVNGRWVLFDSTWDSGNKYLDNTFDNGGIYQYTYFDSNIDAFSVNHRILEFTNDVVAPITLQGFTCSAPSPQNAGNSIVLNCNTSGGLGSVKYKFEVEYQSNLTVLKDYSTDKSTVWTPAIPGTYVIWVSCSDLGGYSVSYGFSYTVTANPNLTITSLNTSVASPQAVGSTIGLSTSASGGTGILQTRYSAYDGTKWTMIKDYSTVTNATWKPTKAGTYDVWVDIKDETGKVVSKKITYVINSTPVINSYAASLLSPQTVGTAIALSTSASGGTGILQTRYSAYDGTKWTMIKDYSTVTNAIWKPTKAGTYDAWVDIKDETGKVVSKKITYVINSTPVINSYVASLLSPQTIGTTIGLSTSASGGTGILQTRYSAYDGTKWTMIKDYSAVTNAIWKPTKAGAYDVWVDIKDETGKVVSKKITYVINNMPVINNYTTSLLSPQTIGTTIGLSTSASGGTGILQTRYSAYDGTKWIMIKDYSTVTNAIWKPTKTGTYDVWVDVKDETGKVISKMKNYTIY